MKAMKACVVAVGLAALAVVASACGGASDTAASAAPTAVTAPSTQLFEGQLSVGGSAFYSFTVNTTGDASVMLASTTTSTSPGTAINVALGLAIGTPLATDCSYTASLPAAAALQSPLINNLTPGIYCVRVFDIGNMKVPLNFAIRIVHT
jgi:hypothetical protein